MLRPECGRRPIQKFRLKITNAKSPRPVPGAGSIVALNSCDADNVPVICPTCQIFPEPLLQDIRNRSAAEEFP
jgi:hypothetical protein